jgi:hypothetical protein
MKISNFIAIAGFVAGASALFTSCVRGDHDDYNTNPNNNNYNNQGTTTNTVFDEEFNATDNYPWTFTDATDSAYASISNGSYQYVDYSTKLSNMTVVGTGVNVQNNFTVSTRIMSNNIMGLIFGASSSSNGYAFYIDTAGNYSLYQEGTGSGASTVIIPSTQDSLYAVKKSWNVLEVDQTNGTWTGYINGTQVFSMAARSLSGNNFGFKVLPATIGYADYIIVKND